jgi:hypothetical protein
MGKPIRAKVSKPKSAPRTTVRKKRTNGLQIRDLMRLVHGALGGKADQKLGVITGASASACEKQLRGDREMGAGQLLAILESDLGKTVFKFVAAHSKAQWAKDFRRQQAIIDLRYQTLENSKRLAALEQEFGR